MLSVCRTEANRIELNTSSSRRPAVRRDDDDDVIDDDVYDDDDVILVIIILKLNFKKDVKHGSFIQLLNYGNR